MTSPHEESARTAYDAVADTYADFFRATEPEAAIELAMVDHFASLLPAGASVVDGGCGAGRMLPYLGRLGLAPVGIDLSPEMIRRAKADHPEFSTAVGSLTNMPFSNGDFDGAFYWYSTIHSSDDELETIFAEAYRIVCGGGWLLVAFQVGDGIREVGQGFRKRGHDIQLMRYHREPDDMTSVASRNGWAAVASLVRGPQGNEADPQAVLIFQRQQQENDSSEMPPQ